MPTPTSRIAALVMALVALAGCGKGRRGAPAGAVEPPGYLGPELLLEVPPRGAMLEEGEPGPWPVRIAGRACDAVHPIARVQIGFETLSPASGGGCQPIDRDFPSRWGLTIVGGEVENAAGEKGALAHAFLRSPTWFSPTRGDAASRAESGILLQLGPAFLDDGDRSTPNDVASIVELELARLDLDAAVGAPALADPDADRDGHLDTTTYHCLLYTVTNKRTGFEAWKNGPATWSGVAVEWLRLETGGLSARVVVRDLRVPFGVMGNVDSGCLGDAQDTVYGEAAAAALAIEGRAEVSIDGQGRPQVAFTSLAATLEGLELDISLGALVDWTGLGSLVGDAIAGEMRGPIQGSIRDALRGALAGQLATALAALAGFQSSIALPASMGGVELLVESAVDHLDFAPERAVIGASVHVRPAAPRPEHAAPRGSMRIGGARPDPGAFAGASVVLGVEDDALNQFLQAAWLGGAFDLSDVSAIADLSGFAGAKLALRSALPPLLMPREGGAAGVDLGWGEVAFDLGLLAPGGDVRVRGFLSAILTLEGLEVDPGGRSFSPVIGPEVEVRVQVEEVNWDDLPASRAMATGMIEAVARAFLPQVLSRALRAFPLPELSLRELDPALPALVLSLRDSRMTRLESYHLVAGEVASQP